MTEVHRLPYVVVRYHYDPVRDEAINVGVVVQTGEGLRYKFLEDWSKLGKAYPFLDVDSLQKTANSLESQFGSEEFRIFDYEKNEPIMLKQTDSRLLSLLKQEINRGIELTSPRFAEMPDVTESQLGTLLGYLFETFVEPPPLRRAAGVKLSEKRTRHAHTTLHRAAKKEIIRRARKAGLEKDCDVDPAIPGQTRKWRFDLKIRPASSLIHHILVLPDLEETYENTAALVGIWRDVMRRHKGLNLAAVYYSDNGIPKKELRDGEKLLDRDGIRTLYVGDLPRYYLELAGQERLR